MTAAEPEVHFTIPGHTGSIDTRSPLWATPLAGKAGAGPACDGAGMLIGDYFTCARRFLLQNNCNVISLAAGNSSHETAHNPLSPGIRPWEPDSATHDPDISSIEISLEKHGAFYHPSRVTIHIPDSLPLILALNCAAASPGMDIIENEYLALRRLKADHPEAPIPQVYGFERIQGKTGDAAFFLAQWFQGFHEFHITSPDTDERIAVWESDGAISLVRFPEACRLYEAASEILTRLYNPVTFEQVFPWHHAAGDFVVRLTGGTPEVRLITVRGYRPMIPPPVDAEPDYALILNALLVFVLNLSMRMRMDRIDGTGAHKLLGPEIIPSVLKGFFRALATHQNIASVPGLADDFTDFLHDFSISDYGDLLSSIIDTYNPQSPETTLIRSAVREHAQCFGTQIEEMAKKSFFIDNGA